MDAPQGIAGGVVPGSDHSHRVLEEMASHSQVSEGGLGRYAQVLQWDNPGVYQQVVQFLLGGLFVKKAEEVSRPYGSGSEGKVSPLEALH